MDCPRPATIYERRPEPRGCYLGAEENRDSDDGFKGKARDTQKRTRWALGNSKKKCCGNRKKRKEQEYSGRYEGRGNEELDLRDGRTGDGCEGSIVQMRHGSRKRRDRRKKAVRRGEAKRQACCVLAAYCVLHGSRTRLLRLDGGLSWATVWRCGAGKSRTGLRNTAFGRGG